ncbi:MAG TPA: peptide deformylase [Chloroflexota bacterium]|nr:peptide deformylase [Chloroflexota bacterium]
MAVRPILVVGNPVLRQKTRRVSKIDKSIQTLIDDMIETMRAAPGVGLAATQVGVPLRLAVIEVEDVVTVLINPEIVRIGEPIEKDEGCLSVPGYWGKITRGETAVAKARDRHGKEIRVKGEGLLAQALQHEIDHLDGVLYIDRIEDHSNIQRVESPSERPSRRRKQAEQQAS